MKKFKCPYCNENTVSRFRKAFAGSLKSKGYKCPKCGGHCVNGKESIIFNIIIKSVVLMAILIKSFNNSSNSVLFALVILCISFIVSKIFDAFFYELDKTWRIDVNRK